MSVFKWIGKEFHLRDGDIVTVRDAFMAKFGQVNLALQSRFAGRPPEGPGYLYLTPQELERNLAPAP